VIGKVLVAGVELGLCLLRKDAEVEALPHCKVELGTCVDVVRQGVANKLQIVAQEALASTYLALKPPFRMCYLTLARPAWGVQRARISGRRILAQEIKSRD
jgi:hypothetical protein